MDDPQFKRAMGLMMGPAIVDGNKATELINGDAIFPSMLQAIRGARQTILFETYIYWSGEIGNAFADALAERARTGVKVHVLLDWVGSAKMDDELLDKMKEAGVEVEKYHPAALVQPGPPEQPHPPQAADRRWRRRVHRRRRHRARCGPATRRTRITGATRTSASKGRWWRRCRA